MFQFWKDKSNLKNQFRNKSWLFMTRYIKYIDRARIDGDRTVETSFVYIHFHFWQANKFEI